MTRSPDPLVETERRIRGVPYALAARALGAFRGRWRKAAPPKLRFDSLPGVRRLEFALAEGGLEMVAELAESLSTCLPSLPTAERGRACIATIDGWLMLGHRERALEIAHTYGAELLESAQGRGRLECLGVACPLLGKDGKWNLLGASLRLARGEMSATDVGHAMGGAPWPLLATPELGLLLFSSLWANEPSRAVGFLNAVAPGLGVPDELQPALHTAPAGTRGEALAELRGVPARRVTRGPLVSVIVAAYDAAATLGYALESLLGQTYAALEILVADDASGERTCEIMRRHARDPRVRLFRSEGNQGAYNVRTQLAAQARGEFVTFHDADDWAFPSRIAMQVAALSRSRARAVVGGLLRVTPQGGVTFFKNQRATRLSRVSLMLARETFLALGGFRSALVGADHEFAAKLRATYGDRAIVRLKAPLMLSRLAPGSAIASRGTESAPDGYRSPVRRAYAQLVFDRYELGRGVTDEEMDERLRELGNWRAPTGLVPL